MIFGDIRFLDRESMLVEHTRLAAVSIAHHSKFCVLHGIF